MKAGNKQLLTNAAIAAALTAGFNSDWFKGQWESLRRELDNGGLKPYVPWILLGAVVYFGRGR